MRHTWLLALALGGCLDFDQLGQNAGLDLAPSPDSGSSPDQSMAVADAAVDATPPPDLAPPDDLVNFTCNKGDFIGCDPNDPNAADYCNDTGDGINVLPCGAQCKGGVDCGLCQPGSMVCAAGATTTCTAQGGFGALTPCPPPLANPKMPGSCFDATSCVACAPVHNGNVCGDGSMNFPSDTSFACDTNTNQITGKTPCAFGCDPMTGGCRDLVPANEAGEHLAQNDGFTCVQPPKAQLAKVAPDMGATIKIDTGTLQTPPAITVGGIVPPGTILWGPPYTPVASKTQVRVMHINSMTLPTNTTVTVTGSYGLVILADDQVTFNGGGNVVTTRVNFGGVTGTAPGPGGGNAQGTGVDGTSSGSSSTGGGGAGYGTMGAPGGDAANGLKGPPGGVAYGAVKAAEPLEGGANGGRGGFSVNAQQVATPGGFGGGALQVTACNGVTVAAGAVLNGSGAGGRAGVAGLNNAPGTGGGGGGSGGTLILEAAQVAIAGELVLNGGGGGGGACSGVNCTPTPGTSWDPSMAPAAPAKGGAPGAGGGGAGGNGGTINSPPSQGGQANDLQGSGGGGGAVGRGYINVSPINQALPVFINNVSPAPMVLRTCVTANGQSPNPCLY